jgi:hypothetical protein
MRLRQLSDLRNDTLKLSDTINNPAVVAADVNELVNQGWTRIYAILCRSGENYYLQQPVPTFNTVSGQDTYYTVGYGGAPAGTAVLPTDLWRIRGLDIQIQAGRWLPLQPYEFEQRNDYQANDWSWPTQPLYDFQGAGLSQSVRFEPPPNSNTPLRLWYYPAAVRMVNDTDTIDGGNGWELYPVLWAARRLALIDENYELLPHLDGEMAKMEQDIKVESARRLAGIAPKMRRVRYKQNWPWPGGGARF